MKTRKLLEKLHLLFDADLREKKRKREALKEVLAELKQKERKWQEKLEREQDRERRLDIEKKVALIHSQRTKGLALLKAEDAENAG